MKKILGLFVILFSVSTLASLPDIVALVNDQPITKYDFESKKKMIITLNNIDVSDVSIDRKLNSQILDLLIEEDLLNQHASKVGASISKEELDEAISSIEQRNNLPKNGMNNFFKEKGLNIDVFRKQIRIELLKNNILGALSNSVSVSSSEIDIALISNNEQNINVEAWIFTSRGITDKELSQMQQLKNRLNSCDKVNSKLYTEFAEAEKFDRPLKGLQNRDQSVILDTKIGASSQVYKEDDKFKLILVCKKDRVLAKDDLAKVKAFLSNKKMSQKARKFFRDLRAKAYIKVMIPG